MSDIYFVSDTHFGHANIIKYSNRPYANVQEMDEKMIQNWNETVQPEDTVWHLGDFAFMQYQQFRRLISRLNGNINVVLGNHDKVIHQNRRDILNVGKIETIQDYKELRFEKNQMIVLAHYGHRVWNKSHHGSIHLYGHSHGSLPPFGKSVDVGVDCKEITSEYRPVSLDEVREYMSKRSFQTNGLHLPGSSFPQGKKK